MGKRLITGMVLIILVGSLGSLVPAVYCAPMSGTLHDLSTDPAYIASGGTGLCTQCHAVHNSFELTLWNRDLVPDATNPDDLCLDCHDNSPPSWAPASPDASRFKGSLHDFTGRPIASRSACGVCHSLHLPDLTSLGLEGTAFPSGRIWTRDLTQEYTGLFQKRDLGQSASIRSNYLVGSTSLCYDCHSGDHLDSDPDPAFDFPNNGQDIAFGGDRIITTGGTLGYYELTDGSEPDNPVDAPSLTQVLASPDSYVPGGHYVLTAMDSGTVDDNYQVVAPSGRLLYEISVGDKIPCECATIPTWEN